MNVLCLLGCFQASSESHRDSVPGCNATMLPHVLWRAPFIFRDTGLPPSRYRGLRHNQGEKKQKGKKVSCIIVVCM